MGAAIFALSFWLIWYKWEPNEMLAITATIGALMVSVVIASIFGEHFVRLAKKTDK